MLKECMHELKLSKGCRRRDSVCKVFTRGANAGSGHRPLLDAVETSLASYTKNGIKEIMFC